MKQIFIEKLPNKTKKKCANCIHFSLWGVATGYCSIKETDKLAFNYCLKEFQGKETIK